MTVVREAKRGMETNIKPLGGLEIEGLGLCGQPGLQLTWLSLYLFSPMPHASLSGASKKYWLMAYVTVPRSGEGHRLGWDSLTLIR